MNKRRARWPLLRPSLPSLCGGGVEADPANASRWTGKAPRNVSPSAPRHEAHCSPGVTMAQRKVLPRLVKPRARRPRSPAKSATPPLVRMSGRTYTARQSPRKRPTREAPARCCAACRPAATSTGTWSVNWTRWSSGGAPPLLVASAVLSQPGVAAPRLAGRGQSGRVTVGVDAHVTRR